MFLLLPIVPSSELLSFHQEPACIQIIAFSAVSYEIFLGSATLGSSSGQSITVDGENALINPEFVESTLNHDIALIRLPEPVEFSGELTHFISFYSYNTHFVFDFLHF